MRVSAPTRCRGRSRDAGGQSRPPLQMLRKTFGKSIAMGNKQGRGWAEFPQNDGGGMRMKIRDCMTAHVVCVGAEEPAETAARLMARYNLGLLPVRGADGRMCGVVTDRDLVLRCMAAGQEAGKLPVARAMSNRVVSVSPDGARACAAAAGRGGWKARRDGLAGRSCAAAGVCDGGRRMPRRGLHVGAADGWVKCSEITAFFVKKCLTDGQGAAIIIRPRRRGRTSCALAHASRARLQKR